ncbi:MAG TPA: phosphoribosyltransferase family protein [Dongiaceae bacterium]|nr:phosphoribosyltransferase family protein [Dongiaceae bacterium]
MPQGSGICFHHNSPISRAFIVSQRGDALEAAINGLKFNHVKGAARELAALLHDYLPLLPRDVLLVPIPTVRSHIRQRGYDQVELIARQVAYQRGLPLERLLRRVTSTTQHRVSRRERQAQAAEAFTLRDDVDLQGKTVLLLDDIVTTGSTFSAAAKLLQEAGATVWAAALAYQPFEK